MFGSWRSLRAAARWLARRRGSGLTLLVALALTVLALLAETLALTFLGLTVLGLTVLALTVLALHVPAVSLLARREIGGRRLLVLADDDLGAVGQIGKAGGHHAIAGREPAGDDRIVFILLRHHDRLRRDDVAIADDIAERSRRTALNRRGRHHHRLR